MAQSKQDLQKIIEVFRKIVRRKTIYNETNLHFEYFCIDGDTIPFKDYGYDSLRHFIVENASEYFYFERVGNDFEFIAPRRLESPSKMEIESTVSSHSSQLASGSDGSNLKALQPPTESTSSASGSSKKLCIVKHVIQDPNEDSPPRKNFCLSQNIRFASPRSTGTSNPFQHFQNNIRISYNVNAQTREVDCRSMDADSNSISMSESKHQQNANEAITGAAYGRNESIPIPSFDYELLADEFQWNVRYWHLKISNPITTNEIWARFYDEFEKNMRTMTWKLTTAVNDNPRNPNVYQTDKVYTVKDNGQYYRAKILNYEKDIDQCKCFLIDVGTTNWYNAKIVYRCPFELQQMRPFAFRVKLHNLTEFKDNRNARDIVVSELSEKVVWARIQTRKQEYFSQRTKAISVVLFEGDNRETNVDLCAKIMEKIVATFSPPKLSQNLTNYVRVSHISRASGIIYAHVLYQLNDLQYMTQMIDAYVAENPPLSFREIKSETDLHKTIANNVSKLYLVYIDRDVKWYRATILQLETDVASSRTVQLLDKCSVYCFLVDYGNTRIIPLKNVYDLDGILSKYPFLAVALALDGINMTRSKVDRLKNLLPIGEKVMVGVVARINSGDLNKPKTISMVKMTRTPQQGESVSSADVNKFIE